MVRLVHAHAVDTRPFLPRREGPGDEARVGSGHETKHDYAMVLGNWMSSGW